MKIIAAVDIMDGSVVRLVRGEPDSKVIYSKDPVGVAQKWEAAGVDMLHLVDIDAALGTGGNNIEIISNIVKSVNIPVQVAGGIRSIQSVSEMLAKKVAKVVLGTLAFKDPNSIKEFVKTNLGKIVISIDQINGMIMIHGWKEVSGSKVADALNLFMPMGIREFLLTSINRDGTLQGPDIMMLSHACSFTSAQIIASGGISRLEDIIKVRCIGCSSAILGKALYDNKLSVSQVKAIS
jgi:phosphoribosylformimino-5-aminoimidazole carboxamide ribotide isomerase